MNFAKQQLSIKVPKYQKMYIKGNNYCKLPNKNRKVFTIFNTETPLNESPKVTKQRKPSNMEPFSPNHSNKSSFHKATHSK